jgi:hypothetical protein
MLALEELQYLPAKTLLRLVERQQAIAKAYKEFQQTVKTASALFRQLEELDIDVSFDISTEYISLGFTGDGRRFATVWGLLRRNGYNTTLRPVKGESTFCSFWERADCSKIFMNFSSTVCRRVKVGTKTVVQDVYEVQCGEPSALEAGKQQIAEHDDDIPF